MRNSIFKNIETMQEQQKAAGLLEQEINNKKIMNIYKQQGVDLLTPCCLEKVFV